ncbi:MAG TPA: DUF4199 domain-containing protein [Cyclobacteriaceae bacterium]|nr:DUF4199 domain-containing protein [Cyclobacteriaceae bacterium]
MKSLKPLLFICVRYSLIAGGLMVLFFVLTYYTGHHPLMIAPFLDFRIVLFGMFIFFALREFRERFNYGTLHFYQGMIGSYVVVLVASVIGSLGLLVFAAIEKDFVPDYITEMTAYLNTFAPEDIEAIGKDVFERNLSLLPATHSRMLAISYFGQGLLIGMFVSIIVSVILRKQPKTP